MVQQSNGHSYAIKAAAALLGLTALLRESHQFWASRARRAGRPSWPSPASKSWHRAFARICCLDAGEVIEAAEGVVTLIDPTPAQA